MSFNELLTRDQSLKLISPSFWEEKIEGICNFEDPLPAHIVFVKDSKILKKLISLTNGELQGRDFSHSGLIFELGFVEKESLRDPQFPTNFLSRFGFWAETKDVQLSMCLLSEIFYKKRFGDLNDFVDGRQMGTANIHPTAFIAQGVFIGERVEIGADVMIHPGAVVMSESVIGDGTILFPHTTLYPKVKVGKNCRIHSQTVIGADGFGYYFSKGIHHKIWHMGGVLIEDDVEIGANSAVDGGTFSPTRIGTGTKIDNFVQIGHNSNIGRGVVLCGHVAIAGSVVIGDYTVFGGRSGIGPGMKLGRECQVAGGALINCDWPDRSLLGGHPARPLKEWMRGLAYVRKESLHSSQKDPT